MTSKHSLIYLVNICFLYQILKVCNDSVYLVDINFQVIRNSAVESFESKMKLVCGRDFLGLQICEVGIREVQKGAY